MTTSCLTSLRRKEIWTRPSSLARTMMAFWLWKRKHQRHSNAMQPRTEHSTSPPSNSNPNNSNETFTPHQALSSLNPKVTAAQAAPQTQVSTTFTQPKTPSLKSRRDPQHRSRRRVSPIDRREDTRVRMTYLWMLSNLVVRLRHDRDKDRCKQTVQEVRLPSHRRERAVSLSSSSLLTGR